MTLPALVSFSGYPWSGKDAAADLLVSRVRFVKTYMQKPLELALLRANPLVLDDKENTIERFEDLHTNLGFDAIKDFAEVRRLLNLGTEIGRDLLGQNVWSNLVFNEVGHQMALGKNVALAGVEYVDDLARVQELGGVCVWINRRRANPPVRGNVMPTDCEVVVENEGTLKDFYVNLVTALEEYKPNEETTDNVG